MLPGVWACFFIFLLNRFVPLFLQWAATGGADFILDREITRYGFIRLLHEKWKKSGHDFVQVA